MTPLRLAVYGVLCLTLVSGSAGATVGSRDTYPRKDLDLTASSQPSSAGPKVTDTAMTVTWTFSQVAKADTVATSSATCDGCAGDAAALQVLYLPRAAQADLDNAATAWSQQCVECGATALSVQVVVAREASRVTPNNRAMAVNAACERCDSASAAFQLVVLAPEVHRMSDEALDELRTWFAEQAAALQAPAPWERRRSAEGTDPEQALDSLERLVNGELDSVTATADVVVTN